MLKLQLFRKKEFYIEKNKYIQLIISILVIFVPTIFSGKIIGFPDYWNLEYCMLLIAGRFVCATLGLYLIYRIFD